MLIIFVPKYRYIQRSNASQLQLEIIACGFVLEDGVDFEHPRELRRAKRSIGRTLRVLVLAEEAVKDVRHWRSSREEKEQQNEETERSK